MADGEEALKVAFMIKRSQLKSKFKTVNFKSRWFVLTPNFLRYHEGTLEQGQGKEKGRILLKHVKVVEEVEAEALGNRPNAFQVLYKDHMDYESYTLYIVALHQEQRKEWIDAIREACDKCGVQWNKNYHSGVWISKQNKYSCCEHLSKVALGCQQSKYIPPKSCNGQNSLSANNNSNSMFQDQSSLNMRNLPPVPAPRGQLQTPTQKKVIALYAYQRAEDGDLDLDVGEEYEVLDESRQFWWRARNKRGEIGYIPSNYVQAVTDQGLEKYGWYYKNCSRNQSEEILKAEKREGCFLVRDSSQGGMYTLSLYTQEVPEGMVRHYHIKKNAENKYYLSDKHAFGTIPELVFYHKHNSGGLVVRLRNSPLDREGSTPTTAGFGHDMWEIDPSEIEVSDMLGSGQFGTVRKGCWRNKQEVAVKEMLSGSMKEDDFIEEARTMMQFQHKHLVQLYGVCTKRKPIYIVIEYMKHGALLQYLRRRKGTLLKDIHTLLSMCVDICSAMKYLESRQFIHRDLAARNCLVGESHIVKVGDFGLARYVLDDEYTSSSGTKFPVKWAPPEVLSFTKFSSKSDVWAFGVLMWEIWTGGEMPYGKMRNPEVVDSVCHGSNKLSQPSSCPIAVYDVMKDCWRKQPDERPPFTELYDSLTRLQEERDYSG